MDGSSTSAIGGDDRPANPRGFINPMPANILLVIHMILLSICIIVGTGVLLYTDAADSENKIPDSNASQMFGSVYDQNQTSSSAETPVIQSSTILVAALIYMGCCLLFLVIGFIGVNQRYTTIMVFGIIASALQIVANVGLVIFILLPNIMTSERSSDVDVIILKILMLFLGFMVFFHLTATLILIKLRRNILNEDDSLWNLWRLIFSESSFKFHLFLYWIGSLSLFLADEDYTLINSTIVIVVEHISIVLAVVALVTGYLELLFPVSVCAVMTMRKCYILFAVIHARMYNPKKYYKDVRENLVSKLINDGIERVIAASYVSLYVHLILYIFGFLYFIVVLISICVTCASHTDVIETNADSPPNYSQVVREVPSQLLNETPPPRYSELEFGKRTLSCASTQIEDRSYKDAGGKESGQEEKV